eukprot:UN25086
MRKWKEAIKTFRKMEKLGSAPNTITYNATIHVCRKAGQMSEAYKLFEEMKGRKCHPDDSTFTELISGFGNLKYGEAALELFEDAKTANALSVPLYTAIINACGKVGNTDKAAFYFDEMKRSGLEPSIVTWGSLMNCFQQAQQYNKVLETYNRFLEENLEPNSFIHSIALTACSKSGDLDGGEEIWNSILDAGNRMYTINFNAYLLGHSIHSEWDTVIELFDSIGQFQLQPDAYTYSIMIDGALQRNKHEEALKFSNKHLEIVVMKLCIK